MSLLQAHYLTRDRLDQNDKQLNWSPKVLSVMQQWQLKYSLQSAEIII